MSTLVPAKLSAREGRIFVGLTTAAIPEGPKLDVPVDPEVVHEKAAYFLGALDWDTRLALRVVVQMFEWLAVFRYLRPFSALDAERQSAWTLAWSYSGFWLFRSIGRLLLTIVKPAHIGRRAVQARMQHPPDRLDDVPIVNEPVQLPPDRLILELPADTEVKTQVAIIGSGAGGAVLAAELAERGIDVVLVEEGRPFPRGTGTFDASRSLQTYYREGGATVALGRPAIPIPLGMAVGGTTTMNSGTCFRVPDGVLDKWEASGIRIDRSELADAYARVEERISVQPVPPELLGGSSHVIARGAEKLGLPHGPLDRNIKNCRMSAVCAFGCPTGGKQAMDVTYVPTALGHGARLYSGLRARRILVENGRATGLVAQARDGGPTLTVKADHVVIAAGTVGSVPLLKSAGVRSPHLGRHMTIHPAAKIVALMPEVVNGWRDTPQGYGVTSHVDDGIMFEGAFVPPAYTAVAFPFAGRAFTSVMEEFPRLAMFGFMVSDEGNGRVYSVAGKPVMFYWMSQRDMERVRKGLKVLSEIFFAAGAERIYLPIAGIEEQPSLGAALDALSRPIDYYGVELAGFHPLGTARMAASNADGVTTPDLGVWGIQGLSVVDGSVIPTSLGVNPQLTIMAMATWSADRIAALIQR